MKRSFRVALLATAASALLAGAAFADDLVTKDRVGPADAPKTLTLRITTDGPYSNEEAWAEGYTKLYSDFIQRHPGWQLKMESMSSNIGQEQARMLEQAKLAMARIAVRWTRSSSPCS